jgi:hypothetical protein
MILVWYLTRRRLKVIAHVKVSLPWPLSERELLLDGYGVDLIDEGRIMVVVGTKWLTWCSQLRYMIVETTQEFPFLNWSLPEFLSLVVEL